MADHNNKGITFFGLTSFRNERKRFGIKQDDRRRHFYTIGKTGMGKSNLMENMAIQDIQNGNGIAYVDPHGEGAEKLLDFIPANRINDVIFFNPADLDYPIAFNVMEKVEFRYRHLVAGGLMAVFKKVWPDVWSARMEYILNNTILALLEYPNSTLLGVNRMLSDPEYRKKVVAEVKDPIVKAFWVTEYARYSQKYEIEATAAIQNKVGQFVSNALIRNVIGQSTSTINMRKIMDEEKVLILNLSKGRIGEDNSRLLGALLITKIQLAAMSRVDIPEQTRRDFYLYVDEFQNFATESFANILSEARKYRLNLIVGHQYITQMDEIVRDAVFGNVGTLCVFRVGAEDAEFLEKEFAPEFTAEDLVNSTKYTVYLKLMIDGVASHPFSAYTLPPPIPLAESNREKIIDASRKTYGVKREMVEEKIVGWMSGPGDGNAAAAPAGASTNLSSTTQVKKEVSAAAFAMPNAAPMEGETKLYDAVCSICGKPTKVIFEPKAGRPVYCKTDMKKIKNAAMAAKPTPKPFVEPRPKPETSENESSALLQDQIIKEVSKEENVASQQKIAEEKAIKEEPAETQEPAKIENVSFNTIKRNTEKVKISSPEKSPKKKEINLADLRKALDASLQKKSASLMGDEVNSKEKTPAVKPEVAGEIKPEIKKDQQVAEDMQDDQKSGVIKPGQKVDL